MLELDPFPKAGASRQEPLRVIRVRGAREHNLQNVNVDIPKERLVVVTGLSGSGKSSLVFDTVFAEGQRKYVESLSAYARQFLDQLKKPDVDTIEGLPPTIAVEQRGAQRSPRSTVATSTEVYDYLRLLFARLGQPTCWQPTVVDAAGRVAQRCGQPINATSASQIVKRIESLAEGTRLYVLAPITREHQADQRTLLDSLTKQGFVRVRVNGKPVELGSAGVESGDNPLGLTVHSTLDVEVDRLAIKPAARARLSDSLETALRTAHGVVKIAFETPQGWQETVYSEHYACPLHPQCILKTLEPRLFSFNSPSGACEVCHGLGVLLEFDESRIIPDATLSLRGGAIAPWRKSGPAATFATRLLRQFCKTFEVDETVPLSTLDAKKRRLLLHGTTTQESKRYGQVWEGVVPQLRSWMDKTVTESVQEFLGTFMSEHPCHTCLGERLNFAALGVRLTASEALPSAIAQRRSLLGFDVDPHRLSITDSTHLSIDEATRLINSLKIETPQHPIAQPILREVHARLGFLQSVGLGYLSLDRVMSTLSGGEAQRIRLATQLGSSLSGAAYVLDEPTVGLHSRDNARLIQTLRHLSDMGNSVIVVEHDDEVIRAADYLIDVGPGPGPLGGHIIAQGTLADLTQTNASITGDFLTGRRQVSVPQTRRAFNKKKIIAIRSAHEHNLKHIDVAFPLGLLICVTGVSGSGKSTLVNEILLTAARKELNGARVSIGAHERITGLNALSRVVDVDQSPLGRTPRSNAATYTGIWDDIRGIFSQAPDARARGYGTDRFSFNVKGGRCENCEGQGQKRISMHFLPDVYVTCDVCQGTRYNVETLDILYRGKNIADILDLNVDDACAFFEAHPRIARVVNCLRDVGLGYLQLGQPSTTLSGGEAQRVKLAAELWKESETKAHQPTLYILDEPTTGLHFEDVRKLVNVMHRLCDLGQTLVVIEHHLDVVKNADWIIDLGPEGGSGGGEIVAQGTPEEVACNTASHTGRYLKPYLDTVKVVHD